MHLYVINPCAEYWFEVIAPKRLSHLAARGQDQGQEVGNRLLAAWGRQTQSHIDLLVEAGGEGMQDDARFEPNPSGTLLAQVQNAILELREVEPGSIALNDDDRSVEVHLCHSLTRELEVLHDHLLGLFAAGDGLRPCDVLVVTPDLEAAAPMIEAVFGTAPAERRIPFTITGRSRNTINAPVRELLALMALVASRCPATAVFGLLQQPLVARRFGLDDDGAAAGARLDAGRRHPLGPGRRAGARPGPARHRQAQPGRRAGSAVPGLRAARGASPNPWAMCWPAAMPKARPPWRWALSGATWLRCRTCGPTFAQPQAARRLGRRAARRDRHLHGPRRRRTSTTCRSCTAPSRAGRRPWTRGGLAQPVAAGVVRQALERVL